MMPLLSKIDVLDIAYDDSNIVKQIHTLGVDASPEEACGLLYLRESRWTILQLTNIAEDRTNRFAISSDEIVDKLQEWLAAATPADMATMVIWHTHPSGGVGPSRIDLQQRTTRANLVVAITPDGPKASVY